MQKILIALCGLLVATRAFTQQPPPAPVVQPFVDGASWVVLKPFTYRIGETAHQITVPAGFVTDFASIPLIFRGVLSPTGQPGRAAIVHDYLYWDQSCTRPQADRILLLAMIESRVSLVTRQAVYRAVRLGGGTGWESNQTERRAGLPRVIPETEIAAIPPLALWPPFRQQLFEKGVRAEPKITSVPAYCAAAMTISVDIP
jgi:hypothetical protein